LRSAAVLAPSAVFWHPFALQFQCVADDSLFCTKTGNLFAKTGNFSVEQGIAVPIPIAFSFKIFPQDFPEIVRTFLYHKIANLSSFASAPVVSTGVVRVR
jgi:hypothetical protein